MVSLALPYGPVIAVGPDGDIQQRLNLRPALDGGLRVTTAAVDEHQTVTPGRYVLVLPPEALFSRRVSVLPRSRSALMAMVQDLFPFPGEDALYGATTEPDGPRCWACPRAFWNKISSSLPEPGMALVARPEPEDILRAVIVRLGSPVADLKPEPSFVVRPAPVLTAILAVAVAASLVLAVDLWDGARARQVAALEAELSRLQQETAPAIAQRQALVRMKAGLSALSEAAVQAAANLPNEMGRILSALPSGTYIDEFVFRDGEIMLSGLGNNAELWALPLGIPAEAIDIADRPKTDRFTIRIPLAGAPSAAVGESPNKGS